MRLSGGPSETLGFKYGEKAVPFFELLLRVFYICDAGSGLTDFPCVRPGGGRKDGGKTPNPVERWFTGFLPSE